MTYPAPDNIEYDPWFDDKVEPSTLLRPTRKEKLITCLLYTSPSPRDLSTSRMPSSA